MNGWWRGQGSESLKCWELEDLSRVLGPTKAIRFSEWNSKEDKIWEMRYENNIILTFCSIFEVGQRCIPMSEDRDFQGMNRLKLSI